MSRSRAVFLRGTWLEPMIWAPDPILQDSYRSASTVKRRRLTLLLGLVVVSACSACEDAVPLSPIGPSGTGGFEAGLAQEVGLQWSPYVGVHADATTLAGC